MRKKKPKEVFFLKHDSREYREYAEFAAPRSPVLKNCLWAFLTGGTICCIAEGLSELYALLGVPEEKGKILVPVGMVTLAAVFTAAGWFDSLAKHAGAGTLVPITGFANAVVSPAIDNRAEGLIAGVGAKMFVVAGPVIVYGTLASVLWGVVFYFLRMGGILS